MEFIALGIAGGFIACLLLLAPLSFFKVEESHRASVSCFGKAKRNADGTLKLWGPGLYFKLPWEKARGLSIMEKKIDLREKDHPFQTMARDGTTLTLEASVRVRADEAVAEAILYEIENPLEQVRNYLSCALRSEIANFGEGLDPGEVFIQLRNQQGTLLKAFEASVTQELKRSYGVTLLGLDVVDISPPQDLAHALNSVQTARADGESMVARAHALREKRLFAAKKRLEVAIKESEAAEMEMVTIGQNLQILEKNGTLRHYLARRADEVYQQSKLSIVRQEEK